MTNSITDRRDQNCWIRAISSLLSSRYIEGPASGLEQSKSGSLTLIYAILLSVSSYIFVLRDNQYRIECTRTDTTDTFTSAFSYLLCNPLLFSAVPCWRRCQLNHLDAINDGPISGTTSSLVTFEQKYIVNERNITRQYATLLWWFDVFSTVHHSIGLFLQPTLMHASI